METASLYPRNISPRIDEALRDSKTASRYIGVLKQMYLLRRIEVKAATVRPRPWRSFKLYRIPQQLMLNFGEDLLDTIEPASN